jgi:hypothetical protein
LAEDDTLIDLINDDKPKRDLQAIAGQFKVLRFELGNTESLWEIISFQIENYLSEQGIEFHLMVMARSLTSIKFCL